VRRTGSHVPIRVPCVALVRKKGGKKLQVLFWFFPNTSPHGISFCSFYAQPSLIYLSLPFGAGGAGGSIGDGAATPAAAIPLLLLLARFST